MPKAPTGAQLGRHGTLLLDRAFFILKAHGTIRDEASLVFTSEDYSRIIHVNPAFQSMMAALLLSHAVVLVGYSLNDPNFCLLIEVVKNSNPIRLAFNRLGNAPSMPTSSNAVRPCSATVFAPRHWWRPSMPANGQESESSLVVRSLHDPVDSNRSSGHLDAPACAAIGPGR